jgi:hypothetical protein
MAFCFSISRTNAVMEVSPNLNRPSFREDSQVILAGGKTFPGLSKHPWLVFG